MLLRNHAFSLILLILFTCAIAFLTTKNAYAEEEYITYKVLKNDTLTNILKNHSLKPIYGKSGSLTKTLKLNPQKQETHGNLIFIGEVLLLPKKMTQSNLFDDKKSSQDALKEDKHKANFMPKEVSKKANTPKIIPQNQNSTLESAKTIKEIAPQIKIAEKTFQKKPEPQLKTNSNKNIFIPNQQEENKPKSQTEYLTLTKTQLPALPLQLPEVAKETTVISRQEINANVKMNYDFILDTSNFCSPNPSCKKWLWELENKCCKPTKKYFLFFEKDSL